MVDHAPHAPPRVASSDHAPPRAVMRPHAFHALADVIHVSPAYAIANVNCLRQPLTSSFDSGYLIIDFSRLTVDFNQALTLAVEFSPGLTFSI